jgi:hypothetical protein
MISSKRSAFTKKQSKKNKDSICNSIYSILKVDNKEVFDPTFWIDKNRRGVHCFNGASSKRYDL